jgi:hypothetical protein
MAPTSKKKGAPPASTSKSVRLPGSKKAGLPTRAEKSKANKARFQKLQAEVVAELKALRPPAGKNVRVVHGAVPKPVEYDEEIARRICIMFATDPSMSLLKLNSNPELPTVWHFYEWLRDNPHLEKAYSRAREAHLDLQAAELEEWSTAPLIGTRKTSRTKTSDVSGSESSEEVQEYDNIERAKLRVATRQWLLARLRPRKYGVAPAETDGGNALQELLDSFRKRDEALEASDDA